MPETTLDAAEYERLIQLTDLLNDSSVAQLDTDEEREYGELLAKLHS